MNDGKETCYFLTPEDYLMQVKDISMSIKCLEGELQDAEKEHDTEYAEDRCEKLRARIRKRKELLSRIDEEIHSLPDNRLSALLGEYYIRGRSWEEVGETIGIKDSKWVRTRLHEKALKLFAAHYPKYFL